MMGALSPWTRLGKYCTKFPAVRCILTHIVQRGVMAGYLIYRAKVKWKRGSLPYFQACLRKHRADVLVVRCSPERVADTLRRRELFCLAAQHTSPEA